MIFEALVNQVLEEQPLPSRISIGPEEVRNIAKTGKVTSRGPYGGHTFFGTKGEEEFPRAMKGLWYSHGTEGPFKPGQKAGYVLKGDPSKMQTPTSASMGQDPEWYKEKGFVTLPPGSGAENIKTIQRIKQPSASWSEPGVLGKERDFGKFMQIYDKLKKAYERAGIKPNPKIGTPKPGMGLAGIAAINAALMDELPPNVKLGLQAGGGGALPLGAAKGNARPFPTAQ